MRDAVIVDAVRTAIGRGKPGGALSGVHPADLSAVVPLLCRIDTLDELDYYRNGGILQYVLRKLAA